MPPSTGDRDEHVVFILVIDDHGICSRPIRNAVVQLFVVVSVVDVDGIAVSFYSGAGLAICYGCSQDE
jgi:hypothetical protein